MNGALGALARFTARVRWEVRHKVGAGCTRLCWLDFAALAAIGFWLGLTVVVNKPLRNDLRALDRQLAATAVLSGEATDAAATPGKVGPAADVAAFVAFLPPLGAREQQLRTFHALAAENGVKLSSVEYGHAALAHLPGRRMTVHLAAAADAASYRKFVHDLLVGLPNLAIDRATTERTVGQPGHLDLRLELALYYRDADVAGDR